VGRVVVFESPGTVAISEYPDPPIGPHEVRIQTLYSGISAGTELTAYRGSNPYLAKRWEPERRLFIPGEVSLEYPVEGWGYEEVGRVTEVGSNGTDVKEGDVIWGAWGHRSTHLMPRPEAALRRLNENVEPVNGVFSQIGGIALNAVLDADIHVGETVAIFGQGVPGLIATQLAHLNGAYVVAVDRIAKRLELADKVGADHVVDAGEGPAAGVIKDLTAGRGADVCIEFSGAHSALHEAIRAVAYNSRVVVSGFFQGEGAGLFLGEEFHHNRVQLICSQISGTSPSLDHRWNEQRLRSTVMALQAEGRLDFTSLITHTFPVDEASDAFRLLDERADEAVQVVLRFE
jgi:2-desacetyl-2-hydroxyethyl bacteriochlorophyllide A dehydrogenase